MLINGLNSGNGPWTIPAQYTPNQKSTHHSRVENGVTFVDDPAAWYKSEVHQGVFRSQNTPNATRLYHTISVDVAVATELLSHNNHNRPADRSLIGKYVYYIENGLFRPGSEIIVGWNGEVLNGQHRLRAVIESGMQVIFSVCFGADPADFPFIDNGKPRSGSDALCVAQLAGQKGQSSGTALAGALKALIEIMSRRRTKIAPHETLEHALSHPRMADCINPGKRLKKNVTENCSPAGASAAYYLILTCSPNSDQLPDFWEQLVTGSGPAFAGSEMNPIKRANDYFRDRLPKELLTLNGRVHPEELIPRTAKVILKAWNFHIKGKVSKPLAHKWEFDRAPSGDLIIY